MKETLVIAGFPGVGKSHYTAHTTLDVSDSDSSQFSWSSMGVRNPDFPNNYINHIESLVGETDVIFVSTHKEVLRALTDKGIPFVVAFPHRSLKEAYLVRYSLRGSPSEFVSLMDRKWGEFHDDILLFLNEVKNNNKVGYLMLNSPDDYIDSRVIEIIHGDQESPL